MSRTILKKLLYMLLLLATHDGLAFMHSKTALMQAAEIADLTSMQMLIKAGEDVNATKGCDQPHAGYPVLRYAIDSGSIEAVNLLLRSGAGAHAWTTSPIYHPRSNVRNLTLLGHAINSGASADIISALIQHGADIHNACMYDKWTPLQIATVRNHEAAILILQAAGANG